jgi:hypothetical protein
LVAYLSVLKEKPFAPRAEGRKCSLYPQYGGQQVPSKLGLLSTDIHCIIPQRLYIYEFIPLKK